MKDIDLTLYNTDFLFVTNYHYNRKGDWPEDILARVFGFESERWLIKYSLIPHKEWSL